VPGFSACVNHKTSPPLSRAVHDAIRRSVAVFLDLLVAFAQLLFRPLELVVRPHEFDGALGDSSLKGRVELA
jgi:hypothetical protein